MSNLPKIEPEVGELHLAIFSKNHQPSNLIPYHIFCLQGSYISYILVRYDCK